MTEFHDELRARVHGSYTLEAGTEMLIRAFGGRFAEPGNPWIDEDPMSGKTWIDFGEIPSNVGVLSGRGTTVPHARSLGGGRCAGGGG